MTLNRINTFLPAPLPFDERVPEVFNAALAVLHAGLVDPAMSLAGVISNCLGAFFDAMIIHEFDHAAGLWLNFVFLRACLSAVSEAWKHSLPNAILFKTFKLTLIRLAHSLNANVPPLLALSVHLNYMIIGFWHLSASVCKQDKIGPNVTLAEPAKHGG